LSYNENSLVISTKLPTSMPEDPTIFIFVKDVRIRGKGEKVDG
jgi:hypothetical protein